MNHSLLSQSAFDERVDLVRWLLRQGANPDGIAPGSCPLGYAVGKGNREIVKVLLDHGANPHLDMGGGMTPRTIAVVDSREEIIRLLDREESGDSTGADTGNGAE